MRRSHGIHVRKRREVRPERTRQGVHAERQRKQTPVDRSREANPIQTREPNNPENPIQPNPMDPMDPMEWIQWIQWIQWNGLDSNPMESNGIQWNGIGSNWYPTISSPTAPPHAAGPRRKKRRSGHSTIWPLRFCTLCSVLIRSMCANAIQNSDMSPQGPVGPPRGHPGSPEGPLRNPKGP